jgi:hypothetical protein
MLDSGVRLLSRPRSPIFIRYAGRCGGAFIDGIMVLALSKDEALALGPRALLAPAIDEDRYPLPAATGYATRDRDPISSPCRTLT